MVRILDLGGATVKVQVRQTEKFHESTLNLKKCPPAQKTDK
jgi:hypothetical protein